MNIRRALRSLFFAILCLACLTTSTPPLGGPFEPVRAHTRSMEFDYAGWILESLFNKGLQGALAPEQYLPPEDQKQLVLEYIQLVQERNNLIAQVTRVYADPGLADPQAQSLVLREQLAGVTQRLNQIAPLAEGILQAQISTVLDELGLTTGGQPIPPVLYKTTDLPMVLIVSPRAEIRTATDVSLVGSLNIEEIEDLEERVGQSMDVSALVVQVGGIGVYPTMVKESGNLPWLAEVVAHEWIHNYLTIRPLGFSYMSNAELRTMNETTANIAGKEIGLAVLQKYYPEFLPEPAASKTASQPVAATVPDEDKPVFNFNQEMRRIRVEVDALLAEGKIAEAEQFMDESRQVFLENGYLVRKLNQAYFAFYGSYADAPGGGAAGQDPIGPAVQALRDRSGSLAEFLNTIGQMTSFEQLQASLHQE